MIFGAVLGLLGVLGILLKRTVLGTLVGFQLLYMGATLIFVFAGTQSEGRSADAQVFGSVIILGGIAQLVGGLALAIRMLYLKGTVSLDQMRSLKQ